MKKEEKLMIHKRRLETGDELEEDEQISKNGSNEDFKPCEENEELTQGYKQGRS